MKYLLLALLFWTTPAVPEQVKAGWLKHVVHLYDNKHLGAPCSLSTDIEEDTCNLEVKPIIDHKGKKKWKPKKT